MIKIIIKKCINLLLLWNVQKNIIIIFVILVHLYNLLFNHNNKYNKTKYEIQ